MPDDFRSRIRKKVLGQEQPEEKTASGFFTPISGDATLEALKQPGMMFNKGASQLMENPLAGVLNIAQGIAGIPFLMATVPLAMTEDIAKTFDKVVGTTDNKGNAKGVGNFLTEGMNGVFQTPAIVYDLSKKGIDAYLRTNGIAPEYVDSKIKQGMIATRLMPPNATEEQFKETQEALDEAGKLGATILGFEAFKLTKNKLAPKVDKINVIPKTEVPQDVKQTLQIEAPKEGTFNQVNIDPTGRGTTIPKTETTQAYTKLELFKEELSAKQTKLVSDRDILKKQAFDRKLTPEQRIDAKNKLKEVSAELNEINKQLPLIEKELQSKRFEVESKTIPEQKLLTEGDRTIPTENVPSNINFSLPKEKTVEIGKESGLKGLPVEKGKDVKESKLGDVASVQKEIIERRTDKAGKEYYFNTETKKRTSKEEYEKLKGTNNAESIRNDEGQVHQGGTTLEEGKGKGSEDLQQQAPEKPSNTQEQVKSVENVSLTKDQISEIANSKDSFKGASDVGFITKDVRNPNNEKFVYVTKEGGLPRDIVYDANLSQAEKTKLIYDKTGLVPKDADIYSISGNPSVNYEGFGVVKVLESKGKGGETSSWIIPNESKQWFKQRIESGGYKLEGTIKETLNKKLSQSTPTKKVEAKVEKPSKTESIGLLPDEVSARLDKRVRETPEFIKLQKEYDSLPKSNIGLNRTKEQRELQAKSAKVYQELFDKYAREETQPKPTESIKTETKVEGKIEDAVKPESTIERLKREALDEFKKNQTTNAGFNPLAYKNQIKYGSALLKEGAVKFADWSQRMIKDLGEKIKPQLLRIWNEIKKFGEDLGKIVVDKIGEFVESKYNPARPMKIVDLGLMNKSSVKPNIKENVFSEGMKDIAKKDRETIKKEYREVIKEKEKFSTKLQNLLKETGDIKRVAKTVLEPITTSVEKVSKDVYRRFRLFGQSYQVNLLKRHELVGDYFEAKKKSGITPDELADYNISLLNGWFDDAKVIAKKYGFEKQLNDVLKAKDDLAKELGVKMVDNHFPRMVEDFDGFVKFLEEKFPDYYKDNFSRMITEKANKVGRELTVEEKATLINNALRGYNPGIALSDIGNMKKRIIQTLDGELARFYHNPDASLLKYVNEMTELSEARKFFGNKGYDVNESIGAYIQELRDGKKLDLEGSRELMEIFKSRFNQKTISNKGITALRDVGVITKLGNPYATMTQLKDLAYSMYFSPLRTPVELAKLIGNKITGKTPEWQIKELGIDPLKIAEELANPKKRAKLVQKFLDYSGFSKLDMIGKETLINTLWSKYQKQAKELKLNTEFERRIERYFGKGEEKTKVLSDLRDGRKTDSTAFLLYNELVGAQPISLIEMPRGYLKGGNWRIAYFLKTFSIRQLDFALNETVRVMRDKSLPKEQRRQGAYNLVKLGTSLALVGASVDQIRSYLMNALVGKKNDQTFADDMLDNLLSASLLSKYDYTKARQNGISEAIGSKLLPPMDFISDPLLYDLPNLLSEKGKALKSTKHIPMLGRFINEYLKDNNRTSRTTRRTR